MIKKLLVFALCFVFSLLVIFGGMLGVDYYRCTQLQKPIFALGINTADDGGSGTYRGLGYTVEIGGHLSAEYGFVVDSLELEVLGRFGYAVSACG